MLSISFLLKESNKEFSLIYMFAFYGAKKPFKYSVSETIQTKYWNKDIQRVREIREFQRAKSINRKLDQFDRAFKDVFDSFTDFVPTPQQLKNELDKKLNKTSHDDNNFINYFTHYIQDNSNRTNINSYITTLRAIKELMDNKVKIENIDYTYIELFSSKFSKKVITRGKYKGQLPTLNYCGLQIKNIKAVLHQAKKQKYTIDDSINNIKKSSETSDSIYLTTSELDAIKNLTLNGRLLKARDIFLIGCYTAMRFSDFSKLTKDNIIEGLIYKTTQKTGTKIVVPLHPIIKEIFERYNYKVPTITDVVLNRYIKEIGKLAGIDSMIPKTITRSGKKVTEFLPKYSLISTHTARRSGATNMYLAGIPSIAIMAITGHRTEKDFMKYIKVSKEQNAQILANHEFFK
jgi:integrase